MNSQIILVNNKSVYSKTSFKSPQLSLDSSNSKSFEDVFIAINNFEERFGVKETKDKKNISYINLDAVAVALKDGINTLSEKMHSLIYYDGMLNCLNPRAYNRDRVNFFIESCKTNTSLGIVSLDIDNFADYNNKYGHNNGDEALKAFVDIVAGVLKKKQNCFLYRKGGEEFIILLPKKTMTEIKEISEEVRRAVEEKTKERALQNTLKDAFTISVGYADYVPDPTKKRHILHTNSERIKGSLSAKKKFKDIFESTFVNMEKRSDEALYVSKLVKAKNVISSDAEIDVPGNHLLLALGRSINIKFKRIISEYVHKILLNIQLESSVSSPDNLKQTIKTSLANLLRNGSDELADQIASSIIIPNK